MEEEIQSIEEMRLWQLSESGGRGIIPAARLSLRSVGVGAKRTCSSMPVFPGLAT